MIVLVHGSQSDARVWGPLCGLAPRGTVLSTIELPDHGRAPDEPTPDPAPLRRALVQHIEALPAPSVTLVGHSLGALLCASIVSELRKNVRHMFLISGFAMLEEDDLALYRSMADGLESGRLDLELLRQVALDAALGDRHRAHEELAAAMQEMPLARALRSLRRAFYLGAPGVPRYTTPATVIHGRDDAAIRHELGVGLAERGAHASLVTLDTDSHLLPLTHTAELARLVFEP